MKKVLPIPMTLAEMNAMLRIIGVASDQVSPADKQAGSWVAERIIRLLAIHQGKKSP